MTRNFLAIGECMVEMAPTGEGTYRLGFAGDTLNTAWYTRRLLPDGWNVSYLTGVGRDSVSDEMLTFFEGAGIGTDLIQRFDDRTVGLYIIQLTDGERSFSYWRSDSAARQLARDGARLDAALAAADVIYFSGITLAILPKEQRGGFLEAVKAARTRGATIAFDPNLRPRLWEAVEIMCASVMEAAAVSDVVLPSFEDEATYFGDAGPMETVNRYTDAGAPLVIVKNGPGEVLWQVDGAPWTFQVPPVTEVVDTTAAGDSFNAAFLASHLQGADLETSVAAGARLAAQVIGRRGALVDLSQTV
ncbi:sugar kinase [uncultured Roseibium sp.]|uniref:sugar kinase n=1 Tax=uncultured Roseibium sp. TaxID=1936171 RepID=UPI0032176C75